MDRLPSTGQVDGCRVRCLLESIEDPLGAGKVPTGCRDFGVAVILHSFPFFAVLLDHGSDIPKCIIFLTRLSTRVRTDLSVCLRLPVDLLWLGPKCLQGRFLRGAQHFSVRFGVPSQALVSCLITPCEHIFTPQIYILLAEQVNLPCEGHNFALVAVLQFLICVPLVLQLAG